MASVSFSYRSKKDKNPLEIRLSFKTLKSNMDSKTGKETPVSFYCRDRMIVDKKFWTELKSTKKFKDVDKVKRKNEIENHLAELENFILTEFSNSSIKMIDKNWLKRVVNEFYFEDKTENIPNDLINYIDYFTEVKKHDLKQYNINRYKALKRKLIDFEGKYKFSCFFKRINENFKSNYIEYCKDLMYSVNTYEKELTRIKTLCRHARSKGVNVSPEFEMLKINKQASPVIFLTNEEIGKIKKLQKLSSKLDIARDWLLISCYTGQRISDFLRFNQSMLITYDNGKAIEFIQKKTGSKVSVPVTNPLQKILDKRNGDFPDRLLEQEYNRLIKCVCKRAGIDQQIAGVLKTKVDDKKTQRGIEGMYPKYKLIASHVGRRTFATLYYGHIPTQKLLPITGHKTENMLLKYIGKNPYEQSKESLQYLMNAKNVMD
mgnify:CR=1 FL=1